jgi:hypothetical protein
MVKTISLAALALVAGSAAVSAQTTGTDARAVDEVRRTAKVHFGPLYLTPAVLLKDAGVDTNVFNASGEQQSDFTLTLTPQSDVAIPFARRALLKATVGTDVVYYATYDSERSVDPQLRLRGELYARRLTLFAEGAYLNTRQRPNFEIDVRSRHVENDAVAGARLYVTPKFSIEAAARRAEARYDADAMFAGTHLQATLNRRTEGMVGAVRHRLTPLTTIGARFDRLSDSFTYSPERDSRSFRIAPGIEFKPAALISGSAWVGYRKFIPNDSARLPAFSGLIADVGLSYTLLGATTFGASYHRDLTYSYEAQQPFFVDNSVGASLRRALGGRFDAIVAADRHRYEYRDLLGDDVRVLLTGRQDTTWVYSANIGYRVRRASRIGVGGSYYSRTSNRVTFVEYDGLRLGVTVNYGF